MDSQHYPSPYHHPYYRVGAGVKDHHHHHHQSVESAAQAAAVQSRILEMRKEKSRDAARSRRGKENHEFYELAKLLPLPAAITSQLDKASIIRLTISYLKLRDFTLNGDPTWSLSSISGPTLKAGKLCKQGNVFDVHQGTHILQSLDGFAFALGADGRFLYISETVSIYLGLSQVEMTGSSFFDYVHHQDHGELAEILGLNLSSPSSSGHPGSPLPPASVASNASSESESTHFTSTTNLMTLNGPHDTLERQFCIRMKSTLTKRGCQHFKSSGYRVVHVVAHLRLEIPQQQQSNNSSSSSNRRESSNSSNHHHPPKIIGLVALAIALPPPSVNELRLENDMFIMRLGLDLKILHVEPRVTELLGFTGDDLVGRSLYSLAYGPDVVQVRKYHSDLMHKGQVMSKYYRLLNKGGGYCWIQSCVTLINNNTTSTPAATPTNNGSNGQTAGSSKSPTTSGGTPSSTGNTNNSTSNDDQQDQCIISINYIISGPEYDEVIMDGGQVPGGPGFEVPSSPIIIKPCGGSRSSPTKVVLRTSSSPLASPVSPSTPTIVSSRGRGDHHHNHHHKASPSITPSSPSPSSPSSVSSSATAVDAKRRRLNSSPVRPWKSPSPTPSDHTAHHHQHHLSHHGIPHHHLSTHHIHDGGGGHETPPATTSNLLRHISVIRETPPILKPQVMAHASPYHPHHHHHPAHHPHAYHPALVDPYAAAYHLYKNGSSPASSMGPAGAAAAAPTATGHPWGYN